MFGRFVISLVLFGLLAGCESTQVAPATAQGFQLTVDESRLWRRVAEERDTLDRSGFVANWPEVERYVNEVLHRLYPEPLRDGTPLYAKVIVDPTMNAFALPDGALYIHSGMLARLQNEAQLAAVLGHELTHATHRHGLKEYRSLKNHSTFLTVMTVGTGGIGGLLGALGAKASISGYSQELEQEADQVGFQLMVAAGYDPREGPKVFKLLLEESKRSKIKEPYFFASHPKLAERIENFDRMVAELPADKRRGTVGTERYEAMLPKVLIGNADAALAVEDFDFAIFCGERCLKLQPGSAAAEFEIAEAIRRRDGKGDAAAALSRYKNVVVRDPGFAAAYRGLGLTNLKLGQKADASVAFERYLALAPTAEDRGYIEAYIQQCHIAN